MKASFTETKKQNQAGLAEYAMKKIGVYFQKLEGAKNEREMNAARLEFEKWYSKFNPYIEQMVRDNEIDYYFLKDKKFLQLSDSLHFPKPKPGYRPILN